MTEGIYCLRKTGRPDFDQTYCEQDFSNIESFTYEDTPIIKTQEYTIEFWL